MKISKILCLLPIATSLAAYSAHAQDQRPNHREITIWIPAKAGTLLGAGYTSSYLTDIRSKTLRHEEPKLRRAIDGLDDLGMRPIRGYGLLPAAVAWQTEVPIHTLVEQQAQTGLSYGELLMANALASKSGRSFNSVIVERANTKSWGDLAEQLGVDPTLVVAKANIAAQRIRDVELRFRHKPQQADSGVSYTGTNQHLSASARLR